MAIPSISSVQPAVGPSSGGDLVRLVGTGFKGRVRVLFGDAPALGVSVRDEAGARVVDLHTPAHQVGAVDIELTNLDADGIPIPGETVVLANAYRFVRPTVAHEADLTRVIRQLLRELKRQVLANVSATVSVDYDDTVLDGLNVIAIAKTPSLTLSGPTLRPNRFYSANVAHEDVVPGVSGPELVRRKPPYTVDLDFTLTAASERTAELFNLMAAVATFLNRNRWVELPRDPADASRGAVRWELDVCGELEHRGLHDPVVGALGEANGELRLADLAFELPSFAICRRLWCPRGRPRRVNDAAPSCATSAEHHPIVPAMAIVTASLRIVLSQVLLDEPNPRSRTSSEKLLSLS